MDLKLLGIIFPSFIIGTAVICGIALMIYYWVITHCRRENVAENQGNSNNAFDSIPSVINLPPSYSTLSNHLPPTYSQACRLIGYHPSDESIGNRRDQASDGNIVDNSRQNVPSEEGIASRQHQVSDRGILNNSSQNIPSVGTTVNRQNLSSNEIMTDRQNQLSADSIANRRTDTTSETQLRANEDSNPSICTVDNYIVCNPSSIDLQMEQL